MGICAPDHPRAVFLDRDGVINRNVFYPSSGEWESPRQLEDFKFVPGALGALRRLREADYLLFLVSNQPSYAKGKTSLENIRAVHAKFEGILADAGIAFTEFFYCFHHPKGVVPDYSGPCVCRKPSPYFLMQAAEKYGLDMTASWIVGDRETDIQCGRAARVRTVLVGDPRNPLDLAGAKPDCVAEDLREAAKLILLAPRRGREPPEDWSGGTEGPEAVGR